MPANILVALQIELLHYAVGDGVALHDVDLGFQFGVQIEADRHDDLFQAEVIGAFKIEQDAGGGIVALGQKQGNDGNQQARRPPG